MMNLKDIHFNSNFVSVKPYLVVIGCEILNEWDFNTNAPVLWRLTVVINF
mgnify:CR=1 FL=1